jgi:O-antigen/teichoic acid export membrane protein
MMKKIHQLIKYPLISGSIVIFLGSTFSSFFNFIFNLFMTRNISVSDYGTFASLLSLITLFGIAGGAFIPTVVTFAGGYFAKKEYDHVRGLFYKIGMLSFFVGFSVFVGFSIFSNIIGEFFRIRQTYLIPLAGFIAFLGYMSLVNMALLRAKLAFTFLSVMYLLSSILRLSFGIIFVLSGFKIAGALWAHALSELVFYMATFIPLNFLLSFRVKTPKIEVGKIVEYGMPAAISTLCLTSFVTTDIVLVKHLFDPESAGIYAGVDLIGKIVFFLTAPIGAVMFPLVVQKKARQENYHKDFVLALFLVLIPSLILTTIYFVIPEFILEIATRSDYVQGASLLGMFGIFSTLYALLYLFTNFFLSIKETRIFLPIAIAALSQAVLIWFFHNSFEQVIMISIVVTSLLLVVFLFYYRGLNEKKAKS